ncbi:MAG: insulinase family protein [Rhodoblastus sp.]
MSVETTTLPSGLRIVSDRMDGAETAAVAVYVAVGSRNESAAEHGMSHLIEHMAFKGTRKRDARAIAAEIEEAGGDLNAETASEHTAYLARLLPGEVDRALEIFADILPIRFSMRRSSIARKTSSCRRSPRSRTTPTISSWS